MRFSERMGIVPKKMIQKDSMDDDLRNSLWNAIYIYCFSNVLQNENSERLVPFHVVTSLLWLDVFKKHIDEIRGYSPGFIVDKIKREFFNASWATVYDIIENMIETKKCCSNGFKDYINTILEREVSAYRVVKGCLIEITGAEEIKEVEKASEDRNDCIYKNVQAHLSTALSLMAKKPNPDYRNSIKESISAVESMAQIVTGKSGSTLSAALKVLSKGKKIHPALNAAFQSMYGYAGDGDGIRHAMLEEPNLTAADARYFLVSCSAFINYLKALMPA